MSLLPNINNWLPVAARLPILQTPMVRLKLEGDTPVDKRSNPFPSPFGPSLFRGANAREGLKSH